MGTAIDWKPCMMEEVIDRWPGVQPNIYCSMPVAFLNAKVFSRAARQVIQCPSLAKRYNTTQYLVYAPVQY
jgi:hypothetical protein